MSEEEGNQATAKQARKIHKGNRDILYKHYKYYANTKYFQKTIYKRKRKCYFVNTIKCKIKIARTQNIV